MLLHTLIPAGLVDELRLMVFPVILGSGVRWYPESPDAIDMQLSSIERFPTGVVAQHLTSRPRAFPHPHPSECFVHASVSCRGHLREVLRCAMHFDGISRRGSR